MIHHSPQMSEPNGLMPSAENSSVDDQTIDELLARLNLSKGENGSPPLLGVAEPGPSSPEESPAESNVDYLPKAPKSMREAGVTDALIEELICKYLLAQGEASIRMIADQICLPFALVDSVVGRLKHEQVLGYIGQAAMNDYICKLTEVGRERGRRYSDLCSYFGATPVPFRQYVESVEAQTINNQNPTLQDLERAFSDLLIDPDMMRKLGPAVNSGKGMFLFGYPGNGKTSIAERVTASFGKYIWIPKTITVDRDIIRLFDPMNHVEAPLEVGSGLLCEHDVDTRWVRIERPTIVVGGELTMEHLEFQYNQ